MILGSLAGRLSRWWECSVARAVSLLPLFGCLSACTVPGPSDIRVVSLEKSADALTIQVVFASGVDLLAFARGGSMSLVATLFSCPQRKAAQNAETSIVFSGGVLLNPFDEQSSGPQERTAGRYVYRSNFHLASMSDKDKSRGDAGVPELEYCFMVHGGNMIGLGYETNVEHIWVEPAAASNQRR